MSQVKPLKLRWLRSTVRFHSTKNYSNTLHLPSTKFSPKIPSGAFANEILDATTKSLYDWQKQRVKTNKFILHDGPPYANGDLHLGHALNKVLKDMINRTEMFYNDKVVEYVPGWDCHGLPIEIKVSKPGLLALEIRSASRAVADEMIEKQKTQFHQFSIMTDWDNIYKTMNNLYEVDQLSIFKKLIENNLLTRQLKPVWYGVDTKTALAEAELEYKKHKSIAVYVKYGLTAESQARISHGEEKVSFLVWTSTPWTLPGNKAICVNKDLNYVKLSNTKELVIVEQSLVESIKSLNPEFDQVIPFENSKLLELKYLNSLTNEVCPILHGNHVTNTAGTGLVHTAPAHGMEDYLVGLEHGLQIKSIVDENGILINRDFPQTPVNRMETIKLLLKTYFNLGMIYKVDYKFIHNYPYDWRSKTPVIQQATPQWFINVDKIKPYALEALESVKFLPDLGVNRLKAFINNRSEWCISRQRSWGVPIPIIYYKNEPLYEVIDFVIDKLNELGTDEWFKEEGNQYELLKWLPPNYIESHQLEIKFLSKSKDTMDVWFDSGTSWTTLGEKAIADLYLEGTDQHRGWFQSSLLNKIISTGINGEFKAISPYKKIVTHGFILDRNSDKMSKSKGNVIAPQDLIEGKPAVGIPKLGVDGLRLWIASSTYVNDISISNEILKRVLDNLKKLRVTFKYLLGNLNNTTTSNSVVRYEDLNNFDKYILSNLKQLQTSCEANYQEYNFQKVLKDLNNNMNNTLSALYFDISKDCLYTDSINSPRRKAIQFVLEHTLKTYIGILSPILPNLSQEVWYECKTLFEQLALSPFMLSYKKFYQLPNYFSNELVEEEINQLLQLRTGVFNKLESLRQGGVFKKNLELEVKITTTNTYILNNSQILDDIFLVSSVIISKPDLRPEPKKKDSLLDSFDVDGSFIEIYHSDLHKCPRCWKLNSVSELELCKRCDEVVNSN